MSPASSTHRDRTVRWYVDLVHGQPSSLPAASVHWIQWQDDEGWDAYAARVKRMASDGVVHGRFQLGLRVDPTDSGIIPSGKLTRCEMENHHV